MNLNFEWNEFFWEARLTSPVWTGFYCGKEKSDGTFTLTFAPEARGDAPLNEQELLLVEKFMATHEQQAQSVMDAVLAAYPGIYADYVDAIDPDFADVDLPQTDNVDGLKKAMVLKNVFIHQLESGDDPYVGYEFACSWDQEHGLGILMRGSRVVEIGGADSAIMLWIAKRDAETHGLES